MFESHHVKEVKVEDKDGMDVDQKDGDVKEVKEKGAKNWIRKIRMGTFEDSGKCKGYVSWYLFPCDSVTLTYCR